MNLLAGKNDSNISTHTNDKITPTSEESVIQSYTPPPKVNAENSTKVNDEININETNEG